MKGLRWVFIFVFSLTIGFEQGLEAQDRASGQGRTRAELRGVATSVSGQPIARALIEATRLAENGELARRFRARSNRNGRFRLRLPVGQYAVEVSAPGFRPVFYRNASTQDGAETLVIQDDQSRQEWTPVLVPLATLSGWAVDGKTGGPVISGQVTASQGAFRSRVNLADDGTFLIEGLEPGSYRVRVLATGYLTGEHAGAVDIKEGDRIEGIEVVVSQGLSLSGKVIGPDDLGLAGVIVLPVSGGGRRQVGETDADGDYRITGLIAGQYRVVARKAGYQQTYYGGVTQRSEAPTVTVGTEDEPRDVRITLTPVGAVFGRVVGPDGNAIAGATVRVESVKKGRRRRGRTGADGTYGIINVPPGAYVVSVHTDGFGTRYYPHGWILEEAKPIQVQDNAHTPGIDFELTPGGQITGIVRVQDSETPIAGGWVSVRRLEQGGTWQIRTNRGGKFELKGLPDGQYVVRANARGFVTRYFDQADEEDQATPVEIEGEAQVSDMVFELVRRSPGDVDQNGVVDFADLILLLRRIGALGNVDALLDLNGDGLIDFQDFEALAQLLRGAGKVASGMGGLQWEALEEEADAVVAGLMAESFPASQGYVLRVIYDPAEAAFLGAEADRTGLFSNGKFWIQEVEPGVLIVTDGREGAVGLGGTGLLARLRFRPLNGGTGVLLQVGHGWVFTGDGAMVPLLLPEPRRLELPPTAFRLLQNVPNPFNPMTTIAFELPEDTEVDLAVYNLVGQQVRALVLEARGAGRYQVTWDARDDLGRDVSSGVYFYRLKAGDYLATRRMLLVR